MKLGGFNCTQLTKVTSDELARHVSLVRSISTNIRLVSYGTFFLLVILLRLFFLPSIADLATNFRTISTLN